MGWRLIDTDIADSYYVTAADEAIAIAKKQNKTPNTLHFYRRNQPTISIGRSRKIQEDILLEECKKNKVKIIRRTTGGGTIYTDENCLIYSLIFDKKQTELTNTNEIFENICKSIVNALTSFNINAQYKHPNDILVNGRKISGSAQIKKDNTILIHGTILVDTNIDLMRKILKKPKTDVTTLKTELGKILSFDQLKFELKLAFEKYFNTKMIAGSFNQFETGLIEKLLRERYQKDSWNYLR